MSEQTRISHPKERLIPEAMVAPGARPARLLDLAARVARPARKSEAVPAGQQRCGELQIEARWRAGRHLGHYEPR